VTDYYQILGVPRGASDDQIKKAFRRLARELHPDVAGSDGEERFKEVQAAYEVLSTPDKRAMYDRGVDPLAPGGGGAGAGFGGGGAFGFGDIFSTFFGGGAPAGPVPRVRRGQDSLIRMDIALEDAVFGAQRELDIDAAIACPSCAGSGAREGTAPQTCAACSGRGQVQRVANSFLGQVMTTAPCNACSGHGTVIPSPCPECRGDGRVRTRRSITVNIPAGISTGARIKLPSHGDVGPGGGPAGDLYVEVNERPHEVFIRDGYDLHCTIHVPMTAAALGTVVELDTLDGPGQVDIKAGTQPSSTVTLRGLGVGRLRGSGRGNLHVLIEVEMPTNLTEEQAALMHQLAALRGEERPAARVAAANPGFFDKLKDRFSGR
jgi:molecular chaperone DnaJ